LLQQAAGTLSYLRTSALPKLVFAPDDEELPLDLSESFVLGLEWLMLAQAQECWWQNAKLSQCVVAHLINTSPSNVSPGNYKNPLLAKLAAHVRYRRLSVRRASKRTYLDCGLVSFVYRDDPGGIPAHTASLSIRKILKLVLAMSFHGVVGLAAPRRGQAIPLRSRIAISPKSCRARGQQVRVSLYLRLKNFPTSYASYGVELARLEQARVAAKQAYDIARRGKVAPAVLQDVQVHSMFGGQVFRANFLV
jgi:programmed cell death 6-interacting protein